MQKNDDINKDPGTAQVIPIPPTCPLDNGCKFYHATHDDMICNANRRVRRAKGCWRFIKLSKTKNRP